MGWTRPIGPIRIWKNCNITDSNGVKREFVIQEIPKEKYEEAVDFMCDIFTHDEITCNSLGLDEDPMLNNAFRKYLNIVIDQGISIAAYDITENSEKPILAAANLLYFKTKEIEKKLDTVEWNEILDDVNTFLKEIAAEKDPRNMYGVEGYLASSGLCVNPNYRKLGLGRILLETRDSIGQTYNIRYTLTVFTSAISQHVAAKCGFNVLIDRLYDNAVNERGQKLFPSLEQKSIKVMIKKLFQ